MRKIAGIELELPYRYRAYFVGLKPFFDIQNESYIKEDSGKIISITPSRNSDDDDNFPIFYDFVVECESGAIICLKGCPGMLVHYVEADK